MANKVFNIQSAADLLPLSEFQLLVPAEMKAYLESAHKFVDEYNKDTPEGRVLNLVVTDINLKGERPGIAVQENPFLSTNYFGMGGAVLSAIAENLGAGDPATLKNVVNTYGFDENGKAASAILRVKVHAVKMGDTYTRTDGSTATYKCPQIVSVQGEREELNLPYGAVDYLARLNQRVDEQAILAARQRVHDSFTNLAAKAKAAKMPATNAPAAAEETVKP